MSKLQKFAPFFDSTKFSVTRLQISLNLESKSKYIIQKFSCFQVMGK